MSEEKLGQHYLAALNEAFPGVVLDHAWQTKDQLTVTVKVNYLPEVVEFLYYKQGGWLSVLFGNDERKLNGHYAVYYVLSMEKGTQCWITVRVEVDANKPEYPSVTPRVPAAVWGEREVRDQVTHKTCLNYVLESPYWNVKGNFFCYLNDHNENTIVDPSVIYFDFANPLQAQEV